jgi:hypothetical protein
MLPRAALAMTLMALLLQRPSYAIPGRAAIASLPPVLLWAWERPEDLRRLPADTGVAFLAQTIHPEADRIRIEPRRQPLRVGLSTALVAVTRVDVEPATPLSDPRLVPQAADAIAATARLPRVSGLQIDFDARASERPFYRALLWAVRARTGAMPLSMTALASWCAADNWLDELPIDEAIPMMFRLGPFNEPFRRAATAGRWSSARCRGSVGVSIDEPQSLRLQARRKYVFSPRRWSRGAVADARIH